MDTTQTTDALTSILGQHGPKIVIGLIAAVVAWFIIRKFLGDLFPRDSGAGHILESGLERIIKDVLRNFMK